MAKRSVKIAITKTVLFTKSIYFFKKEEYGEMKNLILI